MRTFMIYLTLEDLLHCEWSVAFTGSYTSLQAKTQIPAILLQLDAYTLAFKVRKNTNTLYIHLSSHTKDYYVYSPCNA